MSILPWRRSEPEPLPVDPNDSIVNEIYNSYPYGSESFGLRAIIRAVVVTVLELKKRGMI